MFFQLVKNTLFLAVLGLVSCQAQTNSEKQTHNTERQASPSNTLMVGANQTQAYFNKLKGKRIGIVGNQTSVIFKENGAYTHLVDSLLAHNFNIVRVFSPEHGFRGKADAGEQVKNGMDTQTGLPIISLYGKNKKPTPAQLEGLDLLIFDIQDVGTRFYTYISTLHYVLEAAAENNVAVLILDRPNPNGAYVDGPVLELQHKSFVGMHPIPVVHGMSIGEYAQMIVGQNWLESGVKPELEVIPVKNYTRQDAYTLPIKPSPNLPNAQAIKLYPSLCFFEGTQVNAGRGTALQFQVFGSPFLSKNYFDYSYIPKANEGAKNPKHEGQLCYGKNLSTITPQDKIQLNWLIEAYKNTADKSKFFNSFFTKLAGTTKLQAQIEAGLSPEAIRKTWKPALKAFKKMRANYLIYE